METMNSYCFGSHMLRFKAAADEKQKAAISSFRLQMSELVSFFKKPYKLNRGCRVRRDSLQLD